MKVEVVETTRCNRAAAGGGILWNVSNLIHRRLINNPNYRRKWINKFKNEGNFDFTKEYEY